MPSHHPPPLPLPFRQVLVRSVSSFSLTQPPTSVHIPRLIAVAFSSSFCPACWYLPLRPLPPLNSRENNIQIHSKSSCSRLLSMPSHSSHVAPTLIPYSNHVRLQPRLCHHLNLCTYLSVIHSIDNNSIPYRGYLRMHFSRCLIHEKISETRVKARQRDPPTLPLDFSTMLCSFLS